MKVKEMMTSTALKYCVPGTKLHEAAAIMKEANCGALPVVDENRRILGMITDRDICLSLADSYKKPHPQLPVEDIMSPHVLSVHIDDHIARVLKKMRTRKIGRLPVVDDNKKLQGIITIHDLVSGTFSGKADLVDILSSGESISKTIKALNQRYASHEIMAIH